MVLWSVQKFIARETRLTTEKYFGALLLSVRVLQMIPLAFIPGFSKKWDGFKKTYSKKKKISSSVNRIKFSVQLNYKINLKTSKFQTCTFISEVISL